MGNPIAEMWSKPAEGEPSTAEILADSIMMQPRNEFDFTSGVAADPMFQVSDFVPYGTIAKMLALSPLLGTIKPVTRGIGAYLPDVVKQAQKRVVEPVVKASDDAATMLWSKAVKPDPLTLTPEEELELIRILSSK